MMYRSQDNDCLCRCNDQEGARETSGVLIMFYFLICVGLHDCTHFVKICGCTYGLCTFLHECYISIFIILLKNSFSGLYSS